jgi:hypothetical protein
LNQQRNNRFIIRHLTSVVQHIAIVSRQIRARLQQQPDHGLPPPQPRMKNRPPTMLIIGIHASGISRERPHAS